MSFIKILVLKKNKKYQNFGFLTDFGKDLEKIKIHVKKT